MGWRRLSQGHVLGTETEGQQQTHMAAEACFLQCKP